MKTKAGCLGYIGDYTTQLCGDANKTVKKIPIKQPVYRKIRSFCSIAHFPRAYQVGGKIQLMLNECFQVIVLLDGYEKMCFVFW